jgi:hypothetical protein
MAAHKHLEGLMDEPKTVQSKPSKTIPFFTLRRTRVGWEFIKLDVDSDLKKIVATPTVTEPDIKAVSMEKFKIAVGRYWQEAEDAGA